MAARLPRLTAVLLTIAACTAARRSAAQAADASVAGWRQVVSRAEVERSGIMRLGELVRLARRWDAVTVDEYTWRASAGSLAPLEEDEWTVLIDGHEVEASLLGVLALERLPIDLASVDSVVFTSAPVLASGVVQGRGLMTIHARRPRRGLRARGRYATGSETGDPGPFAFLPGAVPNRDRFGHDAEVGVEYGGRGWYAAAGLGLGVHVATDPAIADRLRATGIFPRIERAAPSLRFGVASRRGEHRAAAGRVEIDDWFRLEAYGVEIPVRSTLEHAGVDGAFVPAVGYPALRYRLDYQRAELRSTPFGPALDMESRVLRAQASVSRAGAARRWQAGIRLGHADVEGPGGSPDPAPVEIRAFGELEWAVGAGHRQSLALSGGAAGGALVAGAVLTHRWRAGRADDVVLLVALDQPATTATDLWPLAARGDTWLGDAGVASSIEPEAPRARQAAADLAWARRVAGRLTVSASLFYRASRSGPLARRALSFDAERLAWRGPVSVVAGRPGQVGGITGGAELDIGSRTTLRAWYRVRGLLSGGSEVQAAWSALPAHAGAVEAAFSPVRGFELSGRAAVRGTARPPDYSGSPALDELGARTGAAVTADLGVQKWFWGRRLRAQLAGRNLFDSRSATHPEGGATGRAFVLVVETALP